MVLVESSASELAGEISIWVWGVGGADANLCIQFLLPALGAL